MGDESAPDDYYPCSADLQSSNDVAIDDVLEGESTSEVGTAYTLEIYAIEDIEVDFVNHGYGSNTTSTFSGS